MNIFPIPSRILSIKILNITMSKSYPCKAYLIHFSSLIANHSSSEYNSPQHIMNRFSTSCVSYLKVLLPRPALPNLLQIMLCKMLSSALLKMYQIYCFSLGHKASFFVMKEAGLVCLFWAKSMLALTYP